jgi:hypothetical protein
MNGSTFLAGFISVKDFTFLMMSGSSLQNRSRGGRAYAPNLNLITAMRLGQ